MYRDHDFACSWIGGELVSLAVNYSGSRSFKDTDYAPITTPDGVGGIVRQYGNFSFSRVFQADHKVPSYTPQVSYAIFMRSLLNKDIATGLLPVSDSLKTLGPSDTWHIKNAVPPQPKPKCYGLYPQSCTPEIWEKAKNGSVVIKDFFVIDVEAGEKSPSQAVTDAGARFLAGLADGHGGADGGGRGDEELENAQQRVVDMTGYEEKI